MAHSRDRHPPLGAWRLPVGDEPLVVLELPGELRVPAGLLTPAEQAVADLLLRGHSNAEIAERRGVSARTVANQVARVLEKLGVGSRHALAARLLEVPE